MLPTHVKGILYDVRIATKKFTEREVVVFGRRASKEEIEQLEKLGDLLFQAVIEDDTAKCDRLTTTITKIVRSK